MRSKRLMAVALMAVLLVLVGGYGVNYLRKPHQSAIGSAVNSKPEPPPNNIVATQEVRQRLKAAGWDDEAAGAVTVLNARWFSILKEEHKAHWERQLKDLEKLGKLPTLMPFLQKHPETAGLLGAARNPQLIANTLDGRVDDYPLLAGLYVQHADPDDAAALAEALQTNKEMIALVLRRGLVGVERLFVFGRAEPGSEEYERWLRETFAAKLQGADEHLASMANFAVWQGPQLRRRLASNDDFRRRFRTELWPELVRLTRAEGGEAERLELYCEDPGIWDMLMLPQGRPLLEKWGPLPVNCLFSRDPWPPELRDRVIEILLNRNDCLVQALCEPKLNDADTPLRCEPGFRALLERRLTTDTLTAAAGRLLADRAGRGDLLTQWGRLNDQALIEELGAPPSGIVTWIPLYYTVYEVPKKLIQGRETTTMDWVQVALDVATLATPVKGGGKVAGPVAKAALKKEAGQLAEQQIAKQAGKQIGKQVADKLGEQELTKWMCTKAMSEVQGHVQNMALKEGVYNITGLVKFVYTWSGVGSSTFKRMTGLEARLFMRNDRYVLVCFKNTRLGRMAQNYLRELEISLAIGAAAESDPGQRTVAEGARQATDKIEAWRKCVAAWWFVNASSMDDLPGHAGTSHPSN